MITDAQRPFLATLEQTQEGNRVRVEVTIGFAGEIHRGTAEGTADPQHRARVVGEATLRAVEHLAGDLAEFDLSAVATSDLGPVRIALAQVRESGWSDYLIGSSLVRDGDSATATAKAVLDAVNRRLSLPD
ncbi:MAG: hypothetical protein R3246_04255 [Acidimicrobiia bacterium]|nr:hypothetical protein [Acidimicrobiia bacterium]